MKINRKNLKRICGLNGTTPSELATCIGRHRDTIYKALRNPEHFKPTVREIEKALPIRRLPKREEVLHG